MRPPAAGQVERELAGGSGEPAGQTKEPPPERLRGHDPLTETDPRGPAGEVMGDDLHREPGAIGGEPA